MEDKNLYTDADGVTYTSNAEECTFASASAEISKETLGCVGGDPKEFKKTSSRLHLTLFLYMIVTYGAVYVISIITGLFFSLFPNDSMNDILSSGAFNITVSDIAQYAIAFPIFLLIVKILLEPKKGEKAKMPLGELAVLLLISESLMLIGSIVGSYASQLIGNIFGIEANNSLDEILSTTPTWLIILSVVFLAPIVEEIIYRKIFIDCLGGMGESWAILFSAVAFGFMHSNLYQFFYAFAVGIVFGYVYVRTRDVRYTIAMHMILNFFGSVVTIPVAEAAEKQAQMSEALASGAVIDQAEYALSSIIVFLYSSIQIMLIIGGIIALALYIYLKKVRVQKNTENTPKEVLKAGWLNAGSILFYGFCLILTFLNILQGA